MAGGCSPRSIRRCQATAVEANARATITACSSIPKKIVEKDSSAIFSRANNLAAKRTQRITPQAQKIRITASQFAGTDEKASETVGQTGNAAGAVVDAIVSPVRAQPHHDHARVMATRLAGMRANSLP